MTPIKFFLHLTDEQQRKFIFRRETHKAEPPLTSLRYALTSKIKLKGFASYPKHKLYINSLVKDAKYSGPAKKNEKPLFNRVRAAIEDVRSIKTVAPLKGIKGIPIPDWSK